jgi:hypothetical protein
MRIKCAIRKVCKHILQPSKAAQGLVPIFSRGGKTMKSVLILAFLFIVPVAYANYAQAAGAGCNESCEQAYTTTVAQEKTLKGK